MALSTIKTAIADKIAAVTAATANSDLAILKVLGKKLGLNTDNVTTISNTKSDSATVSTPLTDLVLLTQGVTEYSNNSYVGQVQAFAKTLPISFTAQDGSYWIRDKYFETDSTKVDTVALPIAFMGDSRIAGSLTTGLSSRSLVSNTMQCEIVQLNSGKYISFGVLGSTKPVTVFTDPEIAGTQLLASMASVSHSYDTSTDTLWLLTSGSTLTKITNDGTTVTTYTTSQYFAGNGGAECVFATAGIVFVGGSSGYLSKSINNGTSWSSEDMTGITISAGAVALFYFPENQALYVLAYDYSVTTPSRTVETIHYLFRKTGTGNFSQLATFTAYDIGNICFFNNRYIFSNVGTNGSTTTFQLYSLNKDSFNSTRYFNRTVSSISTGKYRVFVYKGNLFYIGARTASVNEIVCVHVDSDGSMAAIAEIGMTDVLRSSVSTTSYDVYAFVYKDTIYYNSLTTHIKRTPLYGTYLGMTEEVYYMRLK